MKRTLTLLKNQKLLVGCMIVGGLAGYWFPELTKRLAPLDGVFFALLKMCALPILINGLVLSFARLFESEEASCILKRIFQVLTGGCLIAGAIGVVTGDLSSRMLKTDEAAYQALSGLVAETDAKPKSAATFWGFVTDSIPTNIFSSLAAGEIVGVMIFMILLGIAVGKSPNAPARTFLTTLDALNEALYRMIDWISFLLPFALFVIFAKLMAGGNQSIAVFGKLLLACLAGLGVVTLLQIAAIAARYRSRTWRALATLKEPLLISLSSSSSLATLPSLTAALKNGFGIEGWRSNLILPLGIMFGQHSTVFFYALLGAVVAQLYNLPFGLPEYSLLIVASYVKSLVGAGLPALASVSLIEAIFRPLGLPVETLTVLLFTLAPLLDPLLTMTNVVGYCTSAALVEDEAPAVSPSPPEPELSTLS